jgi:hypothetical protein
MDEDDFYFYFLFYLWQWFLLVSSNGMKVTHISGNSNASLYIWVSWRNGTVFLESRTCMFLLSLAWRSEFPLAWALGISWFLKNDCDHGYFAPLSRVGIS